MSISNGFPGSVKLATKIRSGLMSSSDKIKLDSIDPIAISEAKEDIEILKSTVIPNKVYTVRIDLNNSDPYESVSYMNDALGFEPLSVNQSTGECNYGSWKNIIDTVIKPKPCLYKSSSVVTYLNPNNYSSSIYGSGIDITNELSGDIMIEFSKVYYKLEKTGNTVDFSISTAKERPDNTWTSAAFLSEDGLRTEQDHMYFGAYEGWVDEDNKLRSLSDRIPTANRPIFNYRSYSRNNGNTYSMVSVSKRMYISLLTILVTKSLSIKNTIGYGVSDLQYTGDNRAIKTGTMNTKGLFYGSRTGLNGMKVFGIENFIGNLAEFTDGLLRVEDGLYYKSAYPYNDTAAGYNLIGNYPPTGSGWVKSVEVFDGLLVPSEYDAASNNYFSSYVYMPANRTLNHVCAFGGSYYMNLSCDHLCIDFRYEQESTSVATGSRIVSC